jgi:hypothetical protein
MDRLITAIVRHGDHPQLLDTPSVLEMAGSNHQNSRCSGAMP